MTNFPEVQFYLINSKKKLEFFSFIPSTGVLRVKIMARANYWFIATEILALERRHTFLGDIKIKMSIDRKSVV